MGATRRVLPLAAGGKAPARLPRRFFSPDPRVVAERLIGKLLVRDDGRAGRLVEVEAYLGELDPGSHAFRGPTPRSAIMWGPPGVLYVYFSYGVHWCANIVCGAEGNASAVLLRAAEPVAGLDAMRAARLNGRVPARDLPVRDLCRGPGRLTQAFGITGADNGLDLTPPARASALLWLADDGAGPGGEVVATPRVGLAEGRGADLPWRYVLLGSPWASPGPPPLSEDASRAPL